VAYTKLAEVTALEFTANSNPLLSGGFGPNQVSAVLGLALLGCVLLLLERKHPLYLRIVLIVAATVFAAQAALTFSRGGLVLSLISCVGAAMYLLRDTRARATLLLVSAVITAVAVVFVIPRLDEFTSGKLAERYSSVDTTGRALLAGFDLKIFEDNPLLGVGPGVATPIRGEMGHYGVAHTEFTRMLAEHGILGGAAIAFLLVLVLRTIRETRGYHSRAIVVALASWAMLFLLINAIRLVAPAFALGIACSVAYASRRPR
jgi:O-antigen ligase